MRLLATLLICVFAAPAHATDLPIPVDEWRDPGPAHRPLARWWWPGGSVAPDTLRDHLDQIAAAGFGGVELQPLLLGLGADDLAADPKLRTVGEPAFAAAVAVAAREANARGLAFDLTLGSGWPGGLPTTRANAERQWLLAVLNVEGPAAFDGALPPAPDQSYRRSVEWVLDVLGPADPETQRVAVLAARLGGERGGVPIVAEVRSLPDPGSGPLRWNVPEGRWQILVVYENTTGHFVMGGAFPGAEADAWVVDHLSERGADALLEGYAAGVFEAAGPGRIRELFVDSFELLGELPATADLLRAFETRTGYALTPHLPLLFRRGGESKYAEMMDLFGRSGGPRYLANTPGRAERIREDYEWVRAALFEERFIARMRSWAQGKGAALRLQAHGGYADYLDVYARADVPEAEALFAGGRFDFLKLAASAARVAGRRFASSESFITLRLWGRHLDDDEMRLLAGRAYAAGINRLAFHGVPYPYARADGERWYPFSGGFGRILAGPLPMSSDIDAAFLARLPAFNRFLARLTLAMSQGEPAADVAWLRADPLYPDEASLQLGRIEPRAGESATSAALRARGLVHDRVSRRMLTGARVHDGTVHIGAGRYRAILLDSLATAEPALVERLATLAEAGVPIVALGALPGRAPGLRDHAKRDARVVAAVQRLAPWVRRAADTASLEGVLAETVRGGLVEPGPGSAFEVALDRRRGAAAETLLVFNESWEARRETLRFNRAGGALIAWDPWTGKRETLRPRVEAGDTHALDLAPAEVRLLTLASP